MLHLLSFIGVIGVVAGIFFAAVADVFPTHRSTLQGWGGALLVGSAALIGLAFPII